MAATQSSDQNAIAKQLANEAMEGILTARETANVPWSSIQNTGSGGIFLAGFQPIYKPGADGIIDTADDAAAGMQTLKMPGPDGIFGTTDDFISPGADNVYGTGDDFTDTSLAVAGYSREIVISNLSSNLKRIQVTVRYPDGGGQLRNLVAVSYLNNDARTILR